MAKLNDLQLVLVSTAAAHDDGNLLPLADSIVRDDAKTGKAVAGLIKAGFVIEQPAEPKVPVWRSDGDDRFALFITDAGRAAINVEPVGKGEVKPTQTSAPPTAKPVREARTNTKQATVIALLQREQGATLAEMVEATGWLPHTTRAMLTGLKKKGHAITKGKRGDTTCYGIVAKA